MMTPEVRARAARQIRTFTDAYRAATGAGYDTVALSLPSFDTQEDHDRYHPDEAGENFRDFNEFAAEILKGLRANAVPAELVTIHYADYAKWLDGRKNIQENRAAYGAFLIAAEHKDRDRTP